MNRKLWKRIASVLALSAGSLGGPGVAHAAWIEASSDHFVIYADDNASEIRRFAGQLESYQAAMALALGSNAPVPSPSNRVTVYVVRNETAVRALYRSDGDTKASRNVAGFYFPNAGGSVAVVSSIQTSNGQLDFSMIALLHEYAHHFLISSNASSRPRWFNEGAAEFFASSRFDTDGSVWLGRPAQHRAAELYEAMDVRASELLDPAEYDKRKHDGFDAFYGKSWLLYHYLTFEPSRKGQLEKYLTLLDAGKGQREAGLEAFGDFKELERGLDRYLAANKMSTLKFPASLLKIGTVNLRPLTAGEAAIMPALVRSKRGIHSPEEADMVVAMARPLAAQYPRDAMVLSELAEAEYDAGHDKEAIAAADAALAIDPRRVNAYVQKGYALFRMAKDADDQQAAFAKAVTPFIKLNRIENDHPIPLIYFYRSFVEQGKKPTDLALSGLIRAMELAPFDMGLRMNLGQAFLARGQMADARIALLPVANNPHESGMSRAARALVARIDADPNWKGDGAAAVMAGAD